MTEKEIMAKLLQKMTSIETNLITMKRETNHQLSNMQERLTKVEDQLSNVDHRLTNVEERLSNVENRLTKVEENVAELKENQKQIMRAVLDTDETTREARLSFSHDLTLSYEVLQKPRPPQFGK